MKDGIINIYKERGYTSHDVVAKLRGILKQKKTGHIGTLDPAAEGVLPVCVGKATKIAELFSGHDKEYEAEVIFGLETDTEDETGNTEAEKRFDDPGLWLQENRDRLTDIIKSFTGVYMQTPPMYSAKKKDGKKLYEYARQGLEIKREPVPVTIYSAAVTDAYVKDGRPVIRLLAACSKGTYIRTLCSDIGKKEGSGACMGTLLRTKTGPFSIADAVRLSALQESEDPYSFVTPLEEVLSAYPAVRALPEGEKALLNGNIMDGGAVREMPDADGIYRMYDAEGSLKALYEKRDGRLRPFKMFI